MGNEINCFNCNAIKSLVICLQLNGGEINVIKLLDGTLLLVISFHFQQIEIL